MARMAEERYSVSTTHSYHVQTTWTGNRGDGTAGYRAYDRDHEITSATPGEPRTPQPIAGSSDPAFRGDPARWNPEQLLTASLSQCHMLWYLHLCAVAGVVVTEYTDEADGTMLEAPDGGGRFTEVVLRPRVTVSSLDMLEQAVSLHEQASEKCFIANSMNFPVRHVPTVTAPGTA
jgi:organic hydroperoxide reductase OsmC/OhrA